MQSIRGRVHNGVVLLENGAALPEGAAVTVARAEDSPAHLSEKKQRVKFPLVGSKRPGSLRLTGDDIAKTLDEDAVARTVHQGVRHD